MSNCKGNNEISIDTVSSEDLSSIRFSISSVETTLRELYRLLKDGISGSGISIVDVKLPEGVQENGGTEVLTALRHILRSFPREGYSLVARVHIPRNLRGVCKSRLFTLMSDYTRRSNITFILSSDEPVVSALFIESVSIRSELGLFDGENVTLRKFQDKEPIYTWRR